MKNNDVNIARRLASQMWGKVQSQRKLLDGIWWFDCLGHGGIILDINKYPEFIGNEQIVEKRKGSNTYVMHEQHFAPFEEDCEYAKVIWLYPDVLDNLSKRYDLKDKTLYEWKMERLKIIEESLKKWNLGFLKKYRERKILKKSKKVY